MGGGRISVSECEGDVGTYTICTHTYLVEELLHVLATANADGMGLVVHSRNFSFELSSVDNLLR